MLKNSKVVLFLSESMKIPTDPHIFLLVCTGMKVFHKNGRTEADCVQEQGNGEDNWI